MKKLLIGYRFLIYLLFVCLLLTSCKKQSQSFEGTFTGQIQNQPVFLHLDETSSSKYNGFLKEKTFNYLVEGNVIEDTLIGTIKDSSSQINFSLKVIRNGNGLRAELSLLKPMTSKPFQVNFEPIKESDKTLLNQPIDRQSIRELDNQLVGRWIINEDSPKSSSQSLLNQGIQFNAQGTIHTLNSKKQEKIDASSWEVLKNVIWFTKEKNLFLVLAGQDTAREVNLGEYLVSDKKLIIVDKTGQRVIFDKQGIQK